MPVAADLVAFASNAHPETDSGASGGVIDLLRRIDFTQIVANDTVYAISDNGGDTQNLTVEGRGTDGALKSETKTMTGVTGIDLTTLATVERILDAELASPAIGIVTVGRGTDAAKGPDIRDIPATERGFLMFLRKAASDPVSIVKYYLKFFWKNIHSTEALTTAKVKQNADSETRVTHLLANSKDDSATSTNRVTAPGAGDTQDPDTFDDTDKSVPGTDLGFGIAIGVWLEVDLAAADPAHGRTSLYTSELTGESV